MSTDSDDNNDDPAARVHSAFSKLNAATVELASAEKAYYAAGDRSKQAAQQVVDVFLALYTSLPVEVRNKVRHAINISTKQPTYDDSDEGESEA